MSKEEYKDHYFKEEDFVNNKEIFSQDSKLDSNYLEELIEKTERKVENKEQFFSETNSNNKNKIYFYGSRFLYTSSPLIASIFLMDSTIKSAKEDTLSTLFYSLLTISTAFTSGYFLKKLF